MATRAHTIELRYLVALAAVGRNGSFSAAADELGYTQSAVSQQIARLERIVGDTLVERPGGASPVSLTTAGQILLAHAEAISAQLDSAYADLVALRRGAAGVLRIGVYQSVGVRLLPRVLRDFVRSWPRVTVELTEAEDDTDLLAGVERGTLDLAFVAYPMPDGPFTAIELLTDPYVMVVRDDDPLATESGPVPLDAIVDRPLVTYAEMREVHSIENRLGRPELRENVVLRSHDNGTILGLVAEGVGTAVISRLSVDPFRPGLRTRVIEGVRPRIVGIAWHRDRYRMAAQDAFVEIARVQARREPTTR